MKPLEIFLQSLICIFLVANIHISQCQELDELDVLYEYLEELGADAKVGFLSASNYISVKRKLPANARPVYVAHKEDLTEMVLNGSIIAALTSGLPAQEYHDRLHIFSSTIVTLHSILMAPDESGDFPHGVNEEFSTLDLASAINAAIARVQLKEIDLQIAKKNAPKEIVLAHTCKEDDQTQFQVPNRNSAKGVLRKILDQKVIKVLADGPYNWGDNDGNYLVDPPVGFYPDILDAIIDEFRNLAGPDGEIYGADIRMERISTLASPFPWYFLFNGTAHISEPYFILDAAYGGTGKSCAQQEDCPKANLEGGHENCQWGYCRHPNRPRVMMFRPSCTVLGTDSKFFTKRSVPLSFNTTTTDPDHHSTEATTKKLDTTTSSNTGSIIAIVILSLLVVGLAGGVGFLVFREKRGSPVFKQFY